jgi:hypothetical protein
MPSEADAIRSLLLMQYPQRAPYHGEDVYFKANPNVGGMAAEDGAVVLNPHSPLSQEELGLVAANEASRLDMRHHGDLMTFPIAPHQKQYFAKTPYGNADTQHQRHTILARLLTGDQSAGPYTDAQRFAADMFGARQLYPIRRARTGD